MCGGVLLGSWRPEDTYVKGVGFDKGGENISPPLSSE